MMNVFNKMTDAENIRAGDPYDDLAFERLARDHDVWGRAESALCAVFWLAGKGQPPSGQSAADQIAEASRPLPGIYRNVREAYAAGFEDARLTALSILRAQPATATVPADEMEEMRTRKDAAYLERNQVVAALAKCFPSGIARTAIEGWSEDWHGCVYIDLPTGQVSWHYHDSHAHLFAGLPPYAGKWDGHDTAEKYRRLDALQSTAAPQPPLVQIAQRNLRAFLGKASFATNVDREAALNCLDVLEAALKGNSHE